MLNNLIKEKAEYFLMFAYEKVNAVNCYGYTPKKCDSIEYQKAKKRALRMTKPYNIDIYNFIKNEL